jgi:dnd system-associated protein 4
MVNGIEWHKLRVHRENKFEVLVNKLCATKDAKNHNAVFKTVKELMVFAALVGYQLDKFKPLDTRVNSTSISMDTYASTDHDAYIYLLALTKSPVLETIKDENLKDAIGIFEGYCNGGLHHIDDWLIKNIDEPIIKDILFKETLQYLTSSGLDN